MAHTFHGIHFQFGPFCSSLAIGRHRYRIKFFTVLFIDYDLGTSTCVESDAIL